MDKRNEDGLLQQSNGRRRSWDKNTKGSFKKLKQK